MNQASCWSVEWSQLMNKGRFISMLLYSDPAQQFWTMGSNQIQSVQRLHVLGFWVNKEICYPYHQQLPSKPTFGVRSIIRREFPSVSAKDFQVLYDICVRLLNECDSQITRSRKAKNRSVIKLVLRNAYKMSTSYRNSVISVSDWCIHPLKIKRTKIVLLLMFNMFSSDLMIVFTLSNPDTLNVHSKICPSIDHGKTGEQILASNNGSLQQFTPRN